MPLLVSECTSLGNHACSPKSESREVIFFSSLILTVGIAGVLQNKSLTDTLCGMLWRGNRGKKYFGMGAYLSLLGTMIIHCVNCVVVAVRKLLESTNIGLMVLKSQSFVAGVSCNSVFLPNMAGTTDSRWRAATSQNGVCKRAGRANRPMRF